MKKLQEQLKEQLVQQVQSCAEAIEDAVNEGKLEEYFEDVLDVEFYIGYDGDYRGARIALALGGPGIFFDTRDGSVKGYWGYDHAEYYVRRWTCDAADDYFGAQYEMIHGY